MYCYGCTESNNIATFTVSISGTSIYRDTINYPSGYSDAPVSKCAKVEVGMLGLKINKVTLCNFFIYYYLFFFFSFFLSSSNKLVANLPNAKVASGTNQI